jgi:hypothetical protein
MEITFMSCVYHTFVVLQEVSHSREGTVEGNGYDDKIPARL